MKASLWHLLRTTDSLFPTGAYAHSGGLEGMTGEGRLRSAEDAESAIRDILRLSFAKVDLPACGLAHRSAQRSDLPELLRIDQALEGLKAPRELREASRSLGRRRLRVTGGVAGYAEQVELGQTPGHQAVVTGMHLALAGVSREEALLGFGYGTAAGLVATAMKLLPLGQARAQAFLDRLGEPMAEWIRHADRRSLGDLGSFTPALDIAAMRHETASTRIFIS
jgi:urease accessory protein